MIDLTNQEREAIQAVAKRFSATWEEGNDPTDAYLAVGGRRVKVEITTLKRRRMGRGSAARPGLRFDKVATRLMESLQSALRKIMPDGVTVLLTITAPIRLASKTAAVVEDKIQNLLKRGSPGRDARYTIHGNRVQIRFFRSASERAPKFIGFVHNPDTDPLLLLNMTEDLLEVASARAGRRVPKHGGERWLLLISPQGISCLEAYRYIWSQLRGTTNVKKVFMVYGDGRVELLAG